MFEFNCPKCGMTLEAEDSWRGMEVNCPNCDADLVVPEAPSVSTAVTQKKKWLIPAVIGAVVLAGGAAVAILLASGSADAPAEAGTPVAAIESSEPAKEDISPDVRVRELFRSENPDIKELADLIAQTADPMVYESAFLRVFDDALNRTTDLTAKYQIFEAAGALEWGKLNERWQRYTDNLRSDLDNAVQSLVIEDIRALRPLMEKALPNDPLIAEAAAAERFHNLLNRQDIAGLRSFAEECTFPRIKTRAENELRNMSRIQTGRLFQNAQRELSRGNLAGAESILAELQTIAPDDERVRALQGMIRNARDNAGNRPRRQAPPSGNVPLESRVVRACHQGLTVEVANLMRSGADLHKTVRVSRGDSQRTMTFFMMLLERASGRGPMAENVKRCLGVILQNGFVPNEEEKAYIREHLPELEDLIK